MKKPLVIVLLACAVLAGCCNIMTRTEARNAPYGCARHPYYCTASVWSDCVCAPYYAMGGNAPDPSGGIWYAFATVTWPFWVVDEVCEAALDTVFLPADLTYLCTKEGK